ncbi:MAG: acetyl-CoA C-acyltransferase [Chloroflexi bacterium]|nr:acetyl-CoA C-acyltransferase [Chloroflexota bacterium]
MREAVICMPVRTPVGNFGGMFRDVPALTLAATVIKAVVDRTGIDPKVVDDVIFGQCYPNGEAPAMGRVAALEAGLPVTVGGTQIDRRCGSALQAVLDAVMRVQTGVDDVVIAGGAESMSQVEFYNWQVRWGVKGGNIKLADRFERAREMGGGNRYPVPGGMLETAENLRAEYKIPRQEQDELSLMSHQRAVAAQKAGKFDAEIVGITVKGRGGETVITTDENPRADASLEKMAKLTAVRAKIDPESTVTAGNSSTQNDGAAACIVTSPEKAKELGLKPMARVVSWARAGVPPRTMGIGPVPASRKALERAGLKMEDMELIELNEAFAAQVLACTREFGFTDKDFDRLNVNGSGISLGHPVGCTGVRILATLLHEARRRGAHYGLETMCVGGGQGLAAVLEFIHD